MIRFALSAPTSTDDLQDPADSLRWQQDTAARLIQPHGKIVTIYHDIDKSRSLPWDRRPEASRILRDLKDAHRGWDALVIAEPQRAFSGTQFEGILFQSSHYGVGLWIPELGGAVDINNDGHYMALSNYGTMRRAERNRTRLRVANAVRAHAQAGRWLGGRPPYGYLIADLGPHSNPSQAASGARLHQLAPDPMTAPVVQRIYELYLSGAGYKQIATVLTNEGIPSPSAHDRTRNSHRSGHAWAISAVRTILANPRYLGYHVSGRTKKADILLDPDSPALGHVTRQRWQDRAEWVTASVQTYDAIVDETTWHQVAGLIAANARSKAVTPATHRARSGVRRAEPSRSRWPASWSATAVARSYRATRSEGMPSTDARSVPTIRCSCTTTPGAWPYARTASSPISMRGCASCSHRSASRRRRRRFFTPTPRATGKTRPSPGPERRSPNASASSPSTSTDSRPASQPKSLPLG